MIECNEKMQELVALYADGQLSEEEKVKVKKHTDTCRTCQEELIIFQTIEQELDLTNIKAPEFLHKDVMKQISKHNKATNYTWYQPYLSIAAAVVFVVFLGLVGLLNPNIEKNTSDEATLMVESYDTSMTTFDVEEDSVTEEFATEESKTEEFATGAAPRMAKEVEDIEEPPNYNNTILIVFAFSTIVCAYLIYRRAKKR